MLISRVLDGKERDEITKKIDAEDHSHEYQTASELFEMMSRDHSFDVNDGDSLTPGDLVVLYKNTDKGTKLISDPNKFMRKKPNQYVETVVYNEDLDSDVSDISDVYGPEEFQSLFTAGKERIDFLNSRLSLDNILCQKFGGVDIQPSNLTTDYNKQFLFQDPYIKDHLNSLSIGFNQFEGSLLPASLLDYICCKRLEDNYNFYMDNIITYVKHTIEQLKRISNGEYLTDRTKERWKEVNNTEINKSAKILATSTSIPLHVESKSNGRVTTWNDLVHSEVDVRYLSKILEKQIIIEVPKLICGSYKLFSKRFADNLVISCKKGNQQQKQEDKEEENASRVDLVFRLQKSQSGHMMGNINSIMIVQTPPNIINNYAESSLLPLPYKDVESIEGSDKTIKITEICKDEEDNPNIDGSTTGDAAESKDTYFGDYETQCDSVVGTNDYPNSENDCNTFKKSYSESCESTEILRNSLNNEPLVQREPINHVSSSDKLSLTMKTLNMKMYLPEENGKELSLWTHTISKKKSPTRTRIKSPYENRSSILEEKKRKRLLEVRERREKKKLLLNENCKISKHKYTKGGVTPQPSSSVTKLSITNKSFYNSIYGQAIAIENKQEKCKNRIKKDCIPEIPLDEIGAESELPSLSYERNNEKYINKSYYLDNAITEVMYMEMKKKDNCELKGCSASTSVVSSDFRDNLKLLSQIIGPSTTDLHKEDATSDDTSTLNEISIIDDNNDLQAIENADTPPSMENIVPVNSPINVSSDTKSDLKKATSPLECRKSIDKIYNLMNKLGKNVYDEKLTPKNKSLLPLDTIQGQGSSIVEGSDSGTSVKHHLTSSNPSYFSFGKINEGKSKMPIIKKPQTPIVPKVIINAKSQSLKSETDKSKKNKKVHLNISKPGENPLKAISQLLHDIDNVQKTKQKEVESKGIKRSEPRDVKNGSHQSMVKRSSRLDQHLKDSQFAEKNTVILAPRKPKSIDVSKVQHQQTQGEKDKINERLIVDIINEAKEARGEAVKGPPKLYSRLNSLAQPKKSYVQAHSEEYHTKYGKNLMADRLQKLATKQPSFFERKVGSVNPRIKLKKNGAEAISVKPAPMPTIAVSTWQSATNSSKEKSLSPMPPYKYNCTPQTPETLRKMGNVETYIKGHYGRTALPCGTDRALPVEHVSRVPLLPNDIDLISVTSTNTAEESTEIGNKLHHIIDTMIDANNSTLDVLCERVENNSMSKSKNTEQLSIVDNLSREKATISEELYFPVDVFEDKNIITAVSEHNKKSKEIYKDLINYNQPTVRYLTTELAKSENALCRQIPVGTFQKRLRIKNLTLPPKQSIHSLLQSGDTGSVQLKNSLSQNYTACDYDNFSDIKAFPMLSKSDLDWSFVKFPMQIATIGYAFPKYPTLHLEPNSKLKSLHDEVKESLKPTNMEVIKNSLQCSQRTKCFETEQLKIKTEYASQVNVTENSTTVTNNPRGDTIKKKSKVANANDLTRLGFESKSEAEQYVSYGEIKPTKKINDTSSVDYTTSLDMLVGLLNEIQKITTCQTHITNADRNEQQCQELETIINDTAALEKYSNHNPREIVSIASLDKLSQLESNPSIYTFYLSSDEEHETCGKRPKVKNIYTPIYEDKEIYADFHERETVNTFTEVPSIFPITINHSTSVTKSLIGVLSDPSSQSLFPSYIEYKSIDSDNSFNSNKMIIELPKPMTYDKSSRLSLVPYAEKLKIKKTTDLNVLTVSVPKEEENPQAISENRYKSICYKNNYNQDFNPSIRMKRDILVTVYTILVFTVFAALSFPEMTYRV